MSHFTRIKTQIVVLEYLKRALADLKFDYEEGGTVRGFGGQQTKADLVVKTKGYPLGFKKSGETYELVADWWGVRGVNQKTFLQDAMQRYAYHAVCDKLQSQGFEMVSEQVERNGQVHLVLRQMA